MNPCEGQAQMLSQTHVPEGLLIHNKLVAKIDFDLDSIFTKIKWAWAVIDVDHQRNIENDILKTVNTRLLTYKLTQLCPVITKLNSQKIHFL